jgi:hypothetical protein
LGPSAKSAAELESKLEDEIAKRKPERFLWVFLIDILLTCILCEFEDVWLPDLFVILMAIIALLVFAHECDMPFARVYLERAFSRFLGERGGKGGGEPTEES